MPDVLGLIARLDRPTWKFWVSRAGAAQDLGRLGNAAAAAVPSLAKLLFEQAAGLTDSKQMRPLVDGPFASALVSIGPASLPPLLARFDTPIEGVRYVAVETVARFGELAVPSLIAALAGDHKRVQANAAWALRGVGAAASTAVPALERALAIAMKPDAVRLVLDRSGSGQTVEVRDEYGRRDRQFLDSLATGGKFPDEPFELRDHSLAMACLAALEAVGQASLPAAPTMVYALAAGRDDLVVRLTAERALRAATSQSLGSDTKAWERWLTERRGG